MSLSNIGFSLLIPFLLRLISTTLPLVLNLLRRRTRRRVNLLGRKRSRCLRNLMRLAGAPRFSRGTRHAGFSSATRHAGFSRVSSRPRFTSRPWHS
jgi:hypothetical protein